MAVRHWRGHAQDEKHWRELDSKIRSEWHMEIRNLHGDLHFEWDRSRGVLDLKDVDLREAQYAGT